MNDSSQIALIGLHAGMKIKMVVGSLNYYSAGDSAILTRHDSKTGWWALFAGGEWNVGRIGEDFELLNLVIDESDSTDGVDGTVIGRDLTLHQAEVLLNTIIGNGGDAYIQTQYQ